MSQPRRTLTDEEKSAADRLKTIYQHKKKLGRSHGKKITHEWLAETMGWQTQSVVSQYMTGKIPLNLEAVCKFATYLDVSVGDISPELEALLPPENRKLHKYCPVCEDSVELTEKQRQLLSSLVKEMAQKKELTWKTL